MARISPIRLVVPYSDERDWWALPTGRREDTKYLYFFTYNGILFTMPDATIAAEDLFRSRGGIMRMSEALAAGVSRSALYAMRDAGVLEVLSRGVYRLASMPPLESPDLAVVAARVPNGVVCLISALAHHGLTTQVPHAVDLAIAYGSERPRIDYPPVNIYWFKGKAFSEGIETPEIDGREVRVYSAEKSIADAFKYRNKIGLDVALEALKNWRERRGAVFERLLEQARNCRVERVIKPYLEAIA